MSRAGEEKDSFLLTNVEVDGIRPWHPFMRSTDSNTTKGLKDHVGRRVEVTGKADSMTWTKASWRENG